MKGSDGNILSSHFATSHPRIRYSGLDVVRGIGISYYWLLIIQYPVGFEPATPSHRKMVRRLSQLSHAAPSPSLRVSKLQLVKVDASIAETRIWTWAAKLLWPEQPWVRILVSLDIWTDGETLLLIILDVCLQYFSNNNKQKQLVFILNQHLFIQRQDVGPFWG